MQNTISPNRKKELIKFLFNAKLEELKKGDIKAVQTLDDAIHFASLDPADPEYAEKLLKLRKRMRLHELITKAEEVMSNDFPVRFLKQKRPPPPPKRKEI